MTEDPIFYVDGVPLALTENRAPVGSLRSDASRMLRLGNYSGGTNRTFEGVIDDVRIYDRRLSPGEIAALAGLGGGGCTAADDFETDDYAGSTGDIAWAGQSGSTTTFAKPSTRSCARR